MKKIKIVTAFLFLYTTNLLAQYSTDWIRPADATSKTGTMIARDNLDNVIATGYAISNNAYTRKYNKFGVLQWEAISASGIPSEYERTLWVTTDNNNNVFVAGYRYAGSNPGTALAVIVLKYSPDGVQLWKQVISPVNYLTGMSLRCELDNSGNLYVGACGVGALPGFALIKFDTNGNILFTQHSDANAPAYFESMRVKGNKIIMSASGGNPNIAVVAAWDDTGAFLWSNGVQGRGARDVEIDDAGNVYLLTGYFNQVTPTSQMDFEIFKFNPSGIQLWKKDFDFGGAPDFPTRFTYAAGKLSVIGEGQGGNDWITFQINTDGTMLWNSIYNGTSSNVEAPYFIAAKSSGEVFVTGKGGPDVPGAGGSTFLRMITLKYDNTGMIKWVDSANIYSGWGYGCTLASDSSLFVLSGTSMTVFHFFDHTGTGACNTPTGANASNINNTFATFSWAPVAGATVYHVKYKPTSASGWTVVSYNLTTLNIFGLYPGTTYEYAVEAVCASGPSGYSATQTFTTTGTAICTSLGQSQVQEYLSQVWVGGINHISGRDNGYGDFTNIVMSFTRDQNVQGYLSGLVPYPEYEYYSIWIDYNHNNDFTDPGEEVVALYSDFSLISFNFTVPSNAMFGTARMRVIMSHDNAPTPCGVYARGETQDYTVLINDTSTIPPPIPLGLNATNITTASARIFWTPDSTAASYNLRYKKITETTWTIAPLNDTTITLPGLSSITNYNYAVEAVGSVGNSGYTATQAFTTLGGPLPINGLAITASRQDANVLVNWSTQSEQNSAWFDIERSYNGIDFIKIGQVQAIGYSSNTMSYQFTDLTVAKSLIFYRLKMTDLNGSYKISPVVKVAASNGNKQDFLLYPNPAVSNVTIVLNTASKDDLHLKVINQLGQIVKTTQLTKGTQITHLEVSSLTSGLYTVVITGSDTRLVKKLLIK